MDEEKDKLTELLNKLPKKYRKYAIYNAMKDYIPNKTTIMHEEVQKAIVDFMVEGNSKAGEIAKYANWSNTFKIFMKTGHYKEAVKISTDNFNNKLRDPRKASIAYELIGDFGNAIKEAETNRFTNFLSDKKDRMSKEELKLENYRIARLAIKIGKHKEAGSALNKIGQYEKAVNHFIIAKEYILAAEIELSEKGKEKAIEILDKGLKDNLNPKLIKDSFTLENQISKEDIKTLCENNNKNRYLLEMTYEENKEIINSYENRDKLITKKDAKKIIDIYFNADGKLHSINRYDQKRGNLGNNIASLAKDKSLLDYTLKLAEKTNNLEMKKVCYELKESYDKAFEIVKKEGYILDTLEYANMLEEEYGQKNLVGAVSKEIVQVALKNGTLKNLNEHNIEQMIGVTEEINICNDISRTIGQMN